MIDNSRLDRERVTVLAPDRGTVYVLECDGRFKIGHTSRVPTEERIRDFAVGLSSIPQVIMECPCWNARKVESDLRRLFINQRIQGEWFSLSDADLAWIDWAFHVQEAYELENWLYRGARESGINRLPPTWEHVVSLAKYASFSKSLGSVYQLVDRTEEP